MKFMHIAKKDIKIMLKDQGAIVMLLLLPLMFITIMGFALQDEYGSKENPVLVGYIDHDNTKASSLFLESIENTGISLVKINSDKDFLKISNDGIYPVMIDIPSSFEGAILNNSSVELNVYQDAKQVNASNIIFQSIKGVLSEFELSYKLESYGVKESLLINEYVNNSLNSALTNIAPFITVDLNTLSITLPNGSMLASDLKTLLKDTLNEENIKVNNIIIDDLKVLPNSFQQSVPGYAVMFAFFIVMISAKSFLKEKEKGTWNRILISDIKTFDLYFGKFIPNYILNICQILILFVFGRFAFNMSLGNDLFALFCMIAMLSLTSTSLGTLISFIAKTDSQVTAISLFVILFSAALGGSMVPLYTMPAFMQQVAKIVPQSWALLGFQEIIVSNGNFNSVLPNLLVLFMFSLLFLSSALLVLKFSRK